MTEDPEQIVDALLTVAPLNFVVVAKACFVIIVRKTKAHRITANFLFLKKLPSFLTAAGVVITLKGTNEFVICLNSRHCLKYRRIALVLLLIA